ncbi:hypothetical protein LBMAG56_30520 [Verrucomicrobiota bacterium]|nr:hypothetical protein LBMAG56_30520 [Verrucomicrobiota bacterium]
MSRFILNKIARVVEGADQRFRHVFGGPAKHKGVTPKGCKQPLHHLYTFDTADPAFPVQIPGIRFLPLYYSFPYNAGACGYRIKTETEIEVLYMETKKVERDFPYPDYPSQFPKLRVHLAPISYEQHKSLVFYLEAGIEALSDADRKFIAKDCRYPFTQLGGIHRMWQDIPEVACPNPLCEYSKYECFMDVFAVVWNEPHPGIFLWDRETAAGCDVQVIFQICPKCYSIHACNRCT